MKKSVRCVVKSPAETEICAEKVANLLQGGEVIAFTGSMGAGKTTFTRGLVKALGAGDVVSSPTFAIVNEYQGRLKIEHFDMYRVTTWEDLYSTGFFDYLETNAVLLIEWSENIENVLPENCIHIDITMGNTETERILTIYNLEGLE